MKYKAIFILNWVFMPHQFVSITTEQRIDQLVSKTGRTKAYYLCELIVRGLQDLEDYYLAAATVERIRMGDEGTLTSTEVRNDLGD